MKKRILVVDDSQVARNYHINILNSQGFITEAAADGEEALMKAITGRYDLILCDLNMPTMDGLTFIKKFRKEDEETPIIIATTQEEASDRKTGFQAGCNLYITKPISPRELSAKIMMLTGSREDLHQSCRN